MLVCASCLNDNSDFDTFAYGFSMVLFVLGVGASCVLLGLGVMLACVSLNVGVHHLPAVRWSCRETVGLKML